MRIVARIILVLVSAFTGLYAGARPAIGQEPLQLEELLAELRPEYDQKGMLVIYQGTLPTNTPLPATITLRIPSRVAEPHAVAYNDGTLYNADYSTRKTEEWLIITLETPRPNFQLEFYDDLAQSAELRNYTFVWPGDYAVKRLDVTLLPPAGAAEIETDPQLTPVQRGVDSFSYMGSFQDLAAGETRQVAVRYQGSTDVVPRQEVPQTSQESMTGLLLGGAGVAALLSVGALVWYLRRPVPAQARPRPRSRTVKQRKPVAQADATFCTHCGQPVTHADRFCGNCGTPVKRERGGHG
jgi:hypothetical protein